MRILTQFLACYIIYTGLRNVTDRLGKMTNLFDRCYGLALIINSLRYPVATIHSERLVYTVRTIFRNGEDSYEYIMV